MKSIKEQYQGLIRDVLLRNNVRCIEAIDTPDEHFFDRITVNDNQTLAVHKDGIIFDNLLFDYTVDYARVLSYIEDEIFYTHRLGKSPHGYRITFA